MASIPYPQYESDFYNILQSACSEDEPVDKEICIQRDDKGPFYCDFYLKNGCKKLGIPPKTVLEVKRFLHFDTVERYLSVFEAIKPQGIACFYLIVPGKTNESLRRDLPEGFRIESVETMMEKEGAGSSRDRTPFNADALTKKRILIARNASNSGKSTFLLGAGVSIDSGLPSWVKLLKRLVNGVNKSHPGLKMRYSVLDHDAKNSSIIMARFIQQSYGNKDTPEKTKATFEEAIRDALYKEKPVPGKQIQSISLIIKERNRIETLGDGTSAGQAVRRIGVIDSVITYNYDDCLEKQLDHDHVRYNSITKGNRIDSGALPIYHVHGFIPSKRSIPPSDVVLTEESYHDVYNEAYHWSNIEQLHALANTTCFFVGLSMLDPNMRRLIDNAAKRSNDSKPIHFAIMRKSEIKDLELTDKMYEKLGIGMLWVDSFNDISPLLEQIFLYP